MSKTAFIYKNIRIYRLCMNLLYRGGYYKRFSLVNKLIKGQKVTELCFGDLVTASYCRKKGIEWKGYDINPEFVRNAKEKLFNAELADILLLEKFPVSDTVIISGSLYHFHNKLSELISKMLYSAPFVIISEPVINLSSAKGIIGKLAGSSADVNGTGHSFRYTRRSLIYALEHLKKELNISYEIKGYFSKDIIIVIQK